MGSISIRIVLVDAPNGRVWILFALMVYVVEPLVLHRLFRTLALRHKDRAFALAQRFHVIALSVSVIAIVAGVLGAHGGLP